MTMTLITNVDFVQVNGVRCDAHAVLIAPPTPPLLGPPRTRVRGFGVDGAEPIFTVWLDGDESDYTFADSSDPTKIFVGETDTRPLFSGGILTVQGVEFFLQIADFEQPFEITTMPDGDYEETWRLLPRMVAKFWRAPHMPVLRWVSADSVRAMGAAMSSA